jgi:hypothetical protein
VRPDPRSPWTASGEWRVASSEDNTTCRSPLATEELLFRYVRLHWSIPTSAGYGRRLRFLVYEVNGKLIGLFGLSDPVFNLGPRDAWIGWDSETKARRLRYVMGLFVLGPAKSHSGGTLRLVWTALALATGNLPSPIPRF